MAQIPTTEVRDGRHNGETVWICHFNRPDMHKKPLRCVPPTMCIVRPATEAKKRIYYSESFFSPIGKNGKVLAREIGLMDNTGFRLFPGNPLFVFDNKEECIDAWNRQIREHLPALDLLIEKSSEHWREERLKLAAMMIGE